MRLLRSAVLLALTAVAPLAAQSAQVVAPSVMRLHSGWRAQPLHPMPPWRRYQSARASCWGRLMPIWRSRESPRTGS